MSDPIELPRRASPRLTGAFLVASALLVGASGVLTVHLTRGAVEDGVRDELMRTTRLLGSGGFPLNDEALTRVSAYIGAEVVAVDAAGRVLATSLPGEGRAAFAQALVAGTLPELSDEPAVRPGRVGELEYTLGLGPVAARAGRASGGVYVLYPADRLAAHARRAWLPVGAVAAFGALLAVLLGVWSERRVSHARTLALLRLLAAVAHEVRNPLGAIRTLARSLRPRLGPGVDPEPLELIASEADRLTLLVDGLRSVGLPLRTLRRAIDPDQAVNEVLALTRHQLAHRRVEVARERGPQVAIEADPAQVRQVVLNLLQNAADAMPRGGAVQVASRVVDGAWELTIRDEGAGVPPALRPQLFAPFCTTKPKGLGVGLYLSRRLASAHGAALTLVDDGAPGACFLLRWPLAPERAPGEAPPRSASRRARAVDGGAPAAAS